MKTVAEILKAKPNRAVHTISADATVLDAIKMMAEQSIGAVVVVDEDGDVAGIFTERDYARKIILKQRSSATTLVRDTMTRAVIYVRPNDTNEDCMALMTERRIRHLPVMEDGRLIGLVSIGDLVKDIIAEQQFIIDQLERYITGAR